MTEDLAMWQFLRAPEWARAGRLVASFRGGFTMATRTPATVSGDDFEQNFHVRHRLERYGAGRRMNFDDSSPERIAAAIAEEVGRDVAYRDVEVDLAAKAARHLAELL